MLKCILCYDSSKTRKRAISRYKYHMKNIKYLHTVKDDDGNDIQEECTKYIYHVDKSNNHVK